MASKSKKKFRNTTNINITNNTNEYAYDRSRFGHILNWDKYCLYINGHPTLIVSGEFHYWRIPDRTRWSKILRKYRASGLNCVRIYFHWGFHSPDDRVYNFEGNKDVEYLLTLCEQLNLFVLAAPGPYICAETQAGGFPFWLVAKKTRLRNMWFTGFKKYDAVFCEYEQQWFQNILPIIARHQITFKSNGCVIGVQIENELFEKIKGIYSFGLPDEMRFLCKVAREEGITVPLFTNDPYENGSWIARTESNLKKGFFNNSFGLDLYGFDKYVVFVPASATPWNLNAEQDPKKWAPWEPKELTNGVDKLEETVRGFGHDAAKSPLFIPELQGGWFSSYQLNYTFDDIYNYYGDHYTKLLYESALAQGVTISSIYMFYGGTNWGTIGDTDAYTSYDYSACIREYGYMSSRLRHLRLSNFFVRSFSDVFTKTERVSKPTVSSLTDNADVINLQRKTIVDEEACGSQVLFTFMRNFSKDKRTQFQIGVEYTDFSRETIQIRLQCFLPYKTSFIALGNYITITGLRLIMSTLPIYLRTFIPGNEEKSGGDEIWIVPVNNTGELAFEGSIIVEGNIGPSVRNDKSACVVSFNGRPGYAKIQKANGNDIEGNGFLYVLALENDSIGTLHAIFDEPHWAQSFERPHSHVHAPLFITWGTQYVFYDYQTKKIEIEFGEDEDEITILSPTKPNYSFQPEENSIYPLPFIYTKKLKPNHYQGTLIHPLLEGWCTRLTDFSDLEWQATDLSKSALEHFYISGHIIYRGQFAAKYSTNSGAMHIIINMRHRCSVFLNGHFVGGHTTYSKNLFFPGAKLGPDPFNSSLGSKKYKLTEFTHPAGHTEPNELIIVVENWGLCRQSVVFNDAPNPRGILSARVTGLGRGNKVNWAVAGVDVRRLNTPFNTTGFPDEHKKTGWADYDGGILNYGVNPSDGIRWWSFRFRHPIEETHKNIVSAPLRLVLEGSFSAYVLLNETLIGYYHGNGDTPQHNFYLMDGLLNHSEDNKIVLMVYSWEDISKDQVKVDIRGWEVDDFHKTGNLVKLQDTRYYDHDYKELKSWLVWREDISFSQTL
ncbi:5315_t:CDS:2 [Ambispora leptoticha]|uniref:5315_t:CDS:1 n=1 Tax=Ambispora leptoticha TaxID=144679 RepID=A0A9N8ZTH6_9GLOM|nr:5315_t:CDS:2 [Ambispora leptoticha]